MDKQHQYQLHLQWTGNTGQGTTSYRTYERAHEINIPGKPVLLASSDPAFRGDTSRYNPEELLLASLSGCHMLWFLHLCAVTKVVVIDYQDNPTGMMVEEQNGSGRFTEVTLRPQVLVETAEMLAKLDDLHHQANKMCFIANSVNFPVKHAASGKVRT